MNLFNEPELGIDYIEKRGSDNHRYRYYRKICPDCGKVIFKRHDPNTLNYFCDRWCRGAYLSKTQRGSNHPNWQGGKTSFYQRIRNSREYEEWRITVFGRDDYTCQDCGSSQSGNLEVHHIYPVSSFPDKICDIENGITLCVECHDLTRGKEFDFIKKYLLLT